MTDAPLASPSYRCGSFPAGGAHGEHFCPDEAVKSCQGPQSSVKRKSAALVLPMRKGPSPADPRVLRQIESESQAVAVSMQACGAKLAYIAAALGKSESYISLIRSGKRPVPDWFVKPFCHITGTLLLQQFRDLQAAMEEVTARREVERLADMLRQAA